MKFDRIMCNDSKEDILKEQERYEKIQNLEREKENLSTIKDFILWHLDKHKHTRNDLTPMTTLNITKIMLGYSGDLIIFNNSAHCVFDVWIDDPNNKIKGFIEHLLKEDKWMLYAYRLNGVEFIVNHPYIPLQH